MSGTPGTPAGASGGASAIPGASTSATAQSTHVPRPGAPGRSAEQIRRDIEAQQAELSNSMVALRSKVDELTDWRRQLSNHREQLVKGAAIAGFVVGGMLAVKGLRALRRR